MKKMRFISVILAFVLIFTTAIPSAASELQYTGSNMGVFDGNVIQDEFTPDRTTASYKITATETKYYKFSFENQSIEVRTGISIADKFLNMFLGKIDIQILDSYDKILSDFSVRCGYVGNVTLKLEKGATYYVKLSSVWDGYYKMKINSYSDIGGDTWDTATETLSVGQLISSVEASGDKDWFYFETDSTDSFYDFNLENISGSSTLSMSVYEYVEGAGEFPLRDTFSFSASNSNTAYKQLKLKPNARYYMCIGLSSGTGGYQLDIKQTLDAVGDTQDTAYAVEPDTKVTTALDGKDDVDYYTFTTKDYDAYFYFNVDNLSINNDSHLIVYDADGNQLASGFAYSGYDMSVNVKLEPNSVYYFKVYASYSGYGNYSFVISDTPDNYANTQDKAGEIELSEQVSESISGDGDVDFYKFTTEDFDAYYYFNIDNLGIDNDSHLVVYDADGNKITSGFAYSRYDMSVNVKLDPNTEYYFKIYASYSGKGNYKITVTSKADFYPNKQELAKKIPLDKEISASITGDGDVDFYKFTTEDFDAFYHLNIDNLGIDNDSHLVVYDAAGNQITSGFAYSRYDMSVNVKLDPNTEYYFKIYASYSGKGNYKVTVKYSSDAEGDTKEKAAEISLNEPVTRELSSDDDVDWFKFTLDYDCNIRMAVANESGSTKVFEIYSAINKQMVYCSCYYSESKTAILDAGDYYVKVHDNSGYYTLAIGDCGSAHVEGYRYVKATDSADGIKTTYCKSCKTVIKKEVIPRINKASLSYTKATYSGSAKKPSVTVYDVNGDKISSSQYSVSYSSGRINVGTYSVTVTFKGKYQGTETIKFKIVAQSSSKLTAKLSASSYHYNGKSKKPSVTVKNSAGKTVSSKYYTVTYPKSSKNVGTYKVKVKFKGNYTGTKYLYFKVNPAKSAVKKLTAGSKKLTVKLAKSSSGSGYQIQYSTSKNFKSAKTKTVKSNKTTTVTLTKLKSKKTYYVRVRSYKKVGGKTYYSSWSYTKSKKTKK